MPKNYWMMVSTQENFHVTRAQGFTLQGFLSLQRKKVQRMGPGDRLLYYLTGVQQFAATATVTSTFFEAHSRLWTSPHAKEDFPFRVHIKPEETLEEDQFLNAQQIGPRMEYIRKWPPEYWPLAFQGHLHLIPKNDFFLIEQEMRKVARQAARVG